MATHSRILAWETLCTEEPGGLHTVHGVTKSQTQLSNQTATWMKHLTQFLKNISNTFRQWQRFHGHGRAG